MVHTAKTVEGQVAATCRIGDYVVVGPGAVLQSCTIENRAKVGAGAVVMEGALVEEFGVVADGAVVHPGRRVPKGEVWAGNPAQFVRKLTATEMAELEEGAEAAADLAQEHQHEFLPGGSAYLDAEKVVEDSSLRFLEKEQQELNRTGGGEEAGEARAREAEGRQ